MGHEPSYWLLKYDLWDQDERANGSVLSIKATIEVASIGHSINEADEFAKQSFGAYLKDTRLMEAVRVGKHPHIHEDA